MQMSIQKDSSSQQYAVQNENDLVSAVKEFESVIQDHLNKILSSSKSEDNSEIILDLKESYIEYKEKIEKYRSKLNEIFSDYSGITTNFKNNSTSENNDIVVLKLHKSKLTKVKNNLNSVKFSYRKCIEDFLDKYKKFRGMLKNEFDENDLFVYLKMDMLFDFFVNGDLDEKRMDEELDRIFYNYKKYRSLINTVSKQSTFIEEYVA